MPPRPQGQAEVVIGDRYGTSAAGWLVAEAARISRDAGFRAALNDPYAGGAIAARHGRPELGIHAIQLEIGRETYLAADGRNAAPGFDRVASLIEQLAIGLGEALLDRAMPAAAE